jgi:hypothetical protein
MKAKDKAKELVDKFTVVGLQQRNEGMQCALIAVDELIEAFTYLRYEFGDDMYTTHSFWIEVKHEIENYEQH